jgi:hypothetical protein
MAVPESMTDDKSKMENGKWNQPEYLASLLI